MAEARWRTTSFWRREGLTKEFKGFIAVDGVDLEVTARDDPRADRPERRRQDHLLQPPDQVPRSRPAGAIIYKGRDITAHEAGRHRPARARALVPDLGRVPAPDACSRTCASRCSAGAATASTSGAPRRCCARSTREALALIDDGRPGRVRRRSPAVELSYGRKRALEIATTLALDPEMMLLDEPMAGMAPRGRRAHRRADQAGLGEPHHPDGRAQPLGRRLAVRPHHRAGPRPGAGRGRLRHGVEGPARDRGLYRSPAMAEAALAARSAAPPAAPLLAVRGPPGLVRRDATSCTASTSTSRRARW